MKSIKILRYNNIKRTHVSVTNKYILRKSSISLNDESNFQYPSVWLTFGTLVQYFFTAAYV